MTKYIIYKQDKQLINHTGGTGWRWRPPPGAMENLVTQGNDKYIHYL